MSNEDPDPGEGTDDDSWVSDSVDDADEAAETGGVDEPTDADAGDGQPESPSGGGQPGTPSGGGQPGTQPGDGQSEMRSNGGRGSREKGPGEKFCPECGAVINEKAEICPECGVRQSGTGSGDEDERLIAAVLAIVLGGLGAHKFYMGKVGQGIVYLCFSWTLIPALIGLVEGIIYLTKSDEEFHRQYMQN